MKRFLIFFLSFALFAGTASALHRSYSLSAEYYEASYPKPRDYVAVTGKAYGGIVPHHLFVKEFIGKYFSGLENQRYRTVVVIGPNHLEVGTSSIAISAESWQTPFGDLQADTVLAGKLADSGLAVLETLFDREHAIGNLAGFIKKSFPDARILPIILKNKTSAEDIDILVSALHRNIDIENTLVLASVDFSHYQTAAVADFHDARTNACLAAFDYECLKTAEVDSPASLLALEKYLSGIGAYSDRLLYHTDSSAMLKNPDLPGTSHSFHEFFFGEKARGSAYNLLFFGDVMMDRDVGSKIAAHQGKIDWLVNGLSGGENRFWLGQDLISANLESALTKNGAHYPPVAQIDFAFAPDKLAQLKGYGFNYFNIANNHIYDQGARGFVETGANLKSLDISFAGCGDGQVKAGCAGTILNIRDKKIALLGASMVYGPIDRSKLADEIKRLKPVADLVIVQLHWGNEYQNTQTAKQRELAHFLIDNGVDLIIGHHPHVVQGAEVYKGKAIFYSLGNFIFDQYWSVSTQRGLALGVNWTDAGLDFHLFPLIGQKSAVSLAKGAEKDKLLKIIAANSAVTEKQRAMLVSGCLTLAAD